MVRCGYKNGHQEDMCFKGIGMCAKKIGIVLSSMANMLMGPIGPLKEHENLHFDNK